MKENDSEKTYRCLNHHCHCRLEEKGYCSEFCEQNTDGKDICHCDHDCCHVDSGLVAEEIKEPG